MQKALDRNSFRPITGTAGIKQLVRIEVKHGL